MTYHSLGRRALQARILSRHQRAKVEAFIEIALDLLDAVDGDCDLEVDDVPEDDDPAGGAIEDEPHDPDGDYDADEAIKGGGSGT